MPSLDDVFQFLEIAAKKSHLNENTVQARRTACNKLFELLEDDQKTVEYVRENLDVLKSRFSNKYKDVSGQTVGEYARRVKLVLDDFDSWSTDRAAWERSVSTKQAVRAPREEDRKQRTDRPKGSSKPSPTDNGGADTITASFPFSQGRKVTVILPTEGLSMGELKRLGYFLLPYANDWNPDAMPPRANDPNSRVEDLNER